MPILKIVSVVPARFQKNYYSILIEGRKTVRLHEQVLAEYPQIKENAEIAEADWNAILDRAERQRALEYSYLLLSYSPRSQKALTEKLTRKGFQHETIQQTISDLKEKRLLDDNALARAIIESKLKSSAPVGEAKVAMDLARKGVHSEIIAQAFSEVKAEIDEPILDEDDRAYIAIVKRAKQVKMTDERMFSRRLFEFLVRRGFSFDSANKALHRFKREHKIESETDDFSE